MLRNGDSGFVLHHGGVLESAAALCYVLCYIATPHDGKIGGKWTLYK